MLDEALEYLDCKDKKVVVDCTVGLGGHAQEIIKRLPPGGSLIGIDADVQALEIAKQSLNGYEDRFTLVHDNFRNIDKILGRLKIDGVDAMLFDLGVSSLQLDTGARGFSFARSGLLDMRMDQGAGRPLWQVLDSLQRPQLAAIIRDLGEEIYWRKVTDAIISARSRGPIKETSELADIIRRSIRSRGGRIDPATRTFQALRIFLNDELNAAGEAIAKSMAFLRKGARIVVISFHSLEDRIVKRSFRDLDRQGILKVLTKRPLRPGGPETSENPRSRSARFRAAERL